MMFAANRPLCVGRARNAIGADWLEAAIAPASECGRRRRAGEPLFRPGEERVAHAAIVRTAQAARRVHKRTLNALRQVVSDAPDPRGLIARACAGDVLGDVDFFELTRFLEAVLEVRASATDHSFEEIGLPPDPQALWSVFEPGRTPLRTFYLSDAFDEELALLRADAAWRRIAADAARSRLFERIAQYAGIEQVRDGEFILLRERIHGPLPPSLRVLREAPTYLLCDVPLDEEALAALTVLDTVNRSVAECEERVRARLSAQVRENASMLESALEALGALDSFIARVRFAQTYETCVPELLDRPFMRFEAARYLPLDASLVEHGLAYVPISLELDGVGVITGPNMGGKTAALRTCGFLAACVAYGVPVPAKVATLSLFDEIAWVGAGSELESGPLLSAFGAEITEMRGFFERGPSRTLLLMDEFARATTPREGRALLIALLERLRAFDACVFAATHLDNIARDAGASHYATVGLREPILGGGGMLDLESALARIASVMDYHIVRVDEQTAHSADAIALAQALGLDREVVDRALKLL
jgi:DNA mismatch repair protein MutS2